MPVRLGLLPGLLFVLGPSAVGISAAGTASIFGNYAKKNYIRSNYAQSLNKDDMSTQEAQPVEEVVESMRNKRWSIHEQEGGVSRSVGLVEGFVIRCGDRPRYHTEKGDTVAYFRNVSNFLGKLPFVPAIG